MSEDVKPALTAEEWADLECERGEIHVDLQADNGGLWMHGNQTALAEWGESGLGWEDAPEIGMTGPARSPARHALAALALHNQPYGFTWEDVDLLRRLHCDASEYNPVPYAESAAGRLADRIASLLPPRQTPETT